MLSTIDITILSSITIFDFLRALITNLNISNDELIDGYFRYMDNLYLYILISDQYIYRMTLNCMIATLVYFTARNASEIKFLVNSLIKQLFKKEYRQIAKLERHKTFILKKLKELGTKDSEITYLEMEIHFNDYE